MATMGEMSIIPREGMMRCRGASGAQAGPGGALAEICPARPLRSLSSHREAGMMEYCHDV